MIQTIDQGFKIARGADGVNSLIFDSNRAKECIAFALKNDYKRIMLNPYHGFTANNLNDVVPLKNFIQGLIIGSEKIKYNKLNEFTNLNLLGVPDNGIDTVDLKYFPNLSTLNCSINNRLIGLETCKKLEKITISNYKSQSKDLTSLPILANLNHLTLIKTDIVSLKGIERFSNLKKIEIFSAPKLETITPIQVLSKNLVEIQFEQCKKVRGFEILGKLPLLKKIILSESGEVENLAFIRELPLLEFISFWGTNILDGNINYCKGINFVGFDNKRHYTHKSEQFKK